MFKIKSTIVTPTTIICVGLMLVIIGMLAFKEPTKVINLQPTEPPMTAMDSLVKRIEVESAEYKVLKDYQLEISPDMYHVIMYDRGRVVAVLPLDNECNLTKAIMRDND